MGEEVEARALSPPAHPKRDGKMNQVKACAHAPSSWERGAPRVQAVPAAALPSLSGEQLLFPGRAGLNHSGCGSLCPFRGEHPSTSLGWVSMGGTESLIPLGRVDAPRASAPNLPITFFLPAQLTA